MTVVKLSSQSTRVTGSDLPNSALTRLMLMGMHRQGALRGGKQEMCTRCLQESQQRPSWQMQSLTMCWVPNDESCPLAGMAPDIRAVGSGHWDPCQALLVRSCRAATAGCQAVRRWSSCVCTRSMNLVFQRECHLAVAFVVLYIIVASVSKHTTSKGCDTFDTYSLQPCPVTTSAFAHRQSQSNVSRIRAL